MTATFARIPAKAARAKLSATDWDVLHAIGLHADKDGRAYPSMARIAEIAGIQRSNVPRSVCRLKERGILRHNRIARPSGGWQVNQYQLLFEPMGDVISADDTEAGVFSAQTTGDVVSADDTEAGVFSAQTTGDVLDADNTPSKGVITGGNICSHHRQQGVI